MRQSPLQRLAAKYAAAAVADKWIFVIGCYNSGTTLLTQILSRHSRIRGLSGEGVAFTDCLERPEEHGWPRMWFKCAEEMQVDPRRAGEIADRIKRQWSWAAGGRGDCFLEKSIANAARLDFFQRHFQPACFIHITRNGYAVAEGIRRKTSPRQWNNTRYDEQYPISLCAEQWVETERRIEAQRARLDRYHTLRYEDLVAAPGETIRSLLEFLDLPWEERLLARDFGVHGVDSPIVDMNQASIARLGEDDIAQIESVAAAMLSRHGYRVTD